MLLNSNKCIEMTMYGAEILNAKREEVNNLNVFPVPDGDTGSNMNMTFQSGINSIANVSSDSIGETAKIFSKGLLMGARGNSGVILSQFFRGIAEGLEGKNEVSIAEFHAALQVGVDRAYGSVIKAVEGTILTVAREMVANTSDNHDTFESYFEELIKSANVSLTNTPELLPILKEVGVVDSGGAGLVYIFEGMLANLKGEIIEIKQNFDTFMQTEEHPMNPDEIEFRYCTEMLIRLHDQDATDINVVRTKLESLGDSIVAIMDEDILKTHVHTEVPTEVFAFGLTLGDFVHVKSENMRIQAEEAQAAKKSKRKEIGIVTVASSQRMGDMFADIHDIEIISGGQTLNPSIEDIKKAIDACNADNVIILPNNSNIIMAAEAASDLCDDVNVQIIKTKHMTQALECLVHFNLELSFEENIEAMTECLDTITNIEITNAIKDTSIDGVQITEGDFLGIINGKIEYSVADIQELLAIIFEKTIEDDAEIVNVLVGEDGSVRLIEKLSAKIEEESPFIEINIHNSNQPVYSYLISYIC